MGGAFIGVADDATAIFSNPAGLAFLNETALTFEYRFTSLNAHTDEIEGRFNTQFDQAAEELNTSFLALNIRFRGFYFGLFQYDYIDVSQDRSFQSRSLNDGIESVELRQVLLDLEGTTQGVGVARRFGKYKFGLTLNHFSFTGKSNYERAGFSIPVFQNVFYHSEMDDKDTAWGYSIGLHREHGTKFSWGLVWRDNPRLDLVESVVEETDTLLIDPSVDVPFVVPDVLGAGIRYRVKPTLSLLLDWQRIFYSQIIENGFNIVENIGTDQKENYDVNDTHEVHMGFEWLLPGDNSVWAFRGGYYSNPRHAVTYQGDDLATRDRFAGTGLINQDHYTLGFGWVFRNRFELDIAANYWQVGHEITASFIWRKK